MAKKKVKQLKKAKLTTKKPTTRQLTKQKCDAIVKVHKAQGLLGNDLFDRVKEDLSKKGVLKEPTINKQLLDTEEHHYIEDLFTQLLEQHDWQERNAIVEEVCREIKSFLGINHHADIVRTSIIKVLHAEQLL